jgi:hypothetical protein
MPSSVSWLSAVPGFGSAGSAPELVLQLLSRRIQEWWAMVTRQALLEREMGLESGMGLGSKYTTNTLTSRPGTTWGLRRGPHRRPNDRFVRCSTRLTNNAGTPLPGASIEELDYVADYRTKLPGPADEVSS